MSEEKEHEMLEAGNIEDIAGSNEEFTCHVCGVEYIGKPSLQVMSGALCCHCKEAGTYDPRTCQHAFNPAFSLPNGNCDGTP